MATGGSNDLKDLQEKFLRLLEMDRDSDEFRALFAEVDAELEECIGRDMQISVA